jgi:hypothetical protein
MNAMLEPTIVAASTHLPRCSPQDEPGLFDWISAASQGARMPHLDVKRAK